MNKIINILKEQGVKSFKITGREMTDPMFEHDLFLYINRVLYGNDEVS